MKQKRGGLVLLLLIGWRLWKMRTLLRS